MPRLRDPLTCTQWQPGGTERYSWFEIQCCTLQASCTETSRQQLLLTEDWVLKVENLGLACPAVIYTNTTATRWDRAPELMCERCCTVQATCTET